MNQDSSYLLSGLLLGLTAGITPGPLLTLVIAETIRYNKKHGIIVACVPATTDLPLMLITIALVAKLSNFNFVMGIITFIGALYIVYLAYESLTATYDFSISGQHVQHSFRKGFITNMLSPYPYIFWITVGAPLCIKASQVSFSAVIMFIIGFYAMLIGAKIVIALLVDKSKKFLSSKTFHYILKILGLVLLLFAILLVKDGLRFLGIIKNTPHHFF